MKLNKNQKLYRELQDKINEELYDLVDKQCNELFKQHKINRDKFLNEIGRILLKYNTENNVLNLTDMEKIKLYTQLEKEVSKIFSSERKEETDILKRFFVNIAEDKYYTNTYLLSLGLKFNSKKVTNDVLEKVVNRKVKGELWSDRIWKNKNDIGSILKSEVKKFINGEVNLNQIEKILKQRFNQNAYNSKRLVNTETARVMEDVNSKWQSENLIEYVQYSAILDSHTCEDCGEYDGEVYKIDEKPFELPQHPFCRCTYISLPSKDYKFKERLDNTTKENINYKSYREWKENL